MATAAGLWGLLVLLVVLLLQLLMLVAGRTAVVLKQLAIGKGRVAFVQAHWAAAVAVKYQVVGERVGVHAAVQVVDGRDGHRVGRYRGRRRQFEVVAAGRRLVVVGQPLQERTQIDSVREAFQQRMFGGRREGERRGELQRIVQVVDHGIGSRVVRHIAKGVVVRRLVVVVVVWMMVVWMQRMRRVHDGSGVQVEILLVLEYNAISCVLQHLIVFV